MLTFIRNDDDDNNKYNDNNNNNVKLKGWNSLT
jgi:hypothetical protein